MSKNIIENKSFLNLLLTTTREQALALLDSITPNQQLLIIEIIKNVLNLNLPKKAKFYVNKKHKLFERIASKKISKTVTRRLIQKNSSHLLLTLWALKQQLSDLQ